MSSRLERVDELSTLFVTVTGADAVVEYQRSGPSDRELPGDTRVDVEDGLEDALTGAETDDFGDPAP